MIYLLLGKLFLRYLVLQWRQIEPQLLGSRFKGCHFCRSFSSDLNNLENYLDICKVDFLSNQQSTNEKIKIVDHFTGHQNHEFLVYCYVELIKFAN